ncbi:MAG: peptidylprolyl isomerase [Ferruginibacter sp.]
MKKIYLLFVFACCSSVVLSQTLFTYGNSAVDKDEFIRAYNKNKTPVTDKEKALREYLDLYIKFKLKVNAALELRLDTLPQLQFDAQSFRSQIEESYLNNEKEVNNLLAEAFIRSQKDLHVLHFFVPGDVTLGPEDTMKSYKAISGLYSSLAAGNTDYEKLIDAQSIKIRQTDIGFITVFTVPYEYENIIYNLGVGQSSKPYRSKKGWHVFKVIDERKAVGKWKIAQILLATPPEQQAADKILLSKKADSVYLLLQKGSDFAILARRFSDDKITYGAGGELPEFGSGKFEPSFEKEVFKLTRDGEISKPFLSQYGYHIVKRLSQTPVPTDKNDNAFVFELKQKLQQDSRIINAKELFAKEVIKQISFKKTGAVSDADLFRYADSVIANPSSETDNATLYPINNKPVYSFAKTKITGKDWLDFIRAYKGNAELYQGESYTVLSERFIANASMEYYKKHLEDYSADFRYQMEEFKDGNVLFEIMERNIWGKATNDTLGLLKHYNENKTKYLWASSADIILFNCSNKTIAEATRNALKGGKEWKKIAEEANNTLQADSGRFELSQIPVTVDPKSSAGFITEIIVNPADGTASFAKIVKQYAANLQRNFDEAKGLVINDYQNILEERWINELKKKYPVKVNENVFMSLLK